MRYAEGPTVSVDVVIGAPPEVVWALVSDITVPARFSSELQAVEWLDDRRFRGTNRHDAIGEWQTTCTVIESDPPRTFAWAVGDPAEPSATWRFTLTPEGDVHGREARAPGTMSPRTRLEQWARIGPGPSGLTPAIEAMPDKEERIIARRLDEHRVNMLATVLGIKELAERP